MERVEAAHESARRSRGLPAPGITGLWLLGVATAWWFVTREQLTQAELASTFDQLGTAAPALTWLTLTAVIGRFMTLALEATFYHVWWRAWGVRLRWGRFFVTIASLSMIDAWAETLQALVRDQAPGIAAWLAPVLGLALAREPGATGSPALLTALGSLGLATVARIVLTARAQARDVGRGIAIPLVVTGAAWLLTRLVVWWGIDLARGMSPLP